MGGNYVINWSPYDRISAILEEKWERLFAFSAFCYLRTQEEDDYLQTRKKSFTRYLIARHLDLGLPRFQNYEK